MPLAMPFNRGQLVVLVLHSPRERVWGRLLGLEASGVAVRGLELTPWNDVLALVRHGQADQVSVGTRFVPMHRVESLYVDEPNSGAPSMAQLFQEGTGQSPDALLADPLLPKRGKH